MKLNAIQVEAILEQLDIEVIPADHPATNKLCDIFGDHTFFLDNSGLKVLEPADAPGMDDGNARVVSIGDWSGASPGGLTLHEPEQTGEIVWLKGTRH